MTRQGRKRYPQSTYPIRTRAVIAAVQVSRAAVEHRRAGGAAGTRRQ